MQAKCTTECRAGWVFHRYEPPGDEWLGFDPVTFLKQQGPAFEGFSAMTLRARSSATRVFPPFSKLALWGALVACGAPALAGTGRGDLTDSNLTYAGRWDKSAGTTYTSHWGGAYVGAKFTGTTVKAKFASPTIFKVIIDGTLCTSWLAGTTVDLTPTPLPNGTHTLQIISYYDGYDLPFQGLVLDTGATTLPDTRPLVEFIGDSITAGLTTTDGPVSDYAWQTAERLGAQHTQVAYPGVTLVDGYHYSSNNWPGMESGYFKLKSVNSCTDVACADNPQWDFTNYTAKVVVINIGTNDANLANVGASSPPPAIFQSHYTTFLQNVRAKYPNADILVLRPFNGSYWTEAQAAVAARVGAGDAKVHTIDTTDWLTAGSKTDFNDGLHPTDSGHMKITDRLVPILLPYMGVTTVNDSQFTFDNAATWGSGSQAGAYQNDLHWSNTPNAYYQVLFTGTQVRLYGPRASLHGIAAVSIDGGPETLIDTYAAVRADGVLLWNSPVLAAGSHTLKVRVTGTNNPKSSNSYIVADRVDVVNGGPNLLANAGFENGLNSWQVWASGASKAYAESGTSHSGAAHLTNWSATPYWAATYQTATGLSNGLYTVSAWVRGSGGQQLYVKNFGAAQRSADVPATGTYTQIVIGNVNVTNNQAEIGFWSNDTSGNAWLQADDVTFYKQ